MIRRTVSDLASSNLSNSIIKTLAPQLQQRCSKSRTAKGTMMTKRVQSFKKSRTNETDSSSTTPTIRNAELEKLASDCLNAPCPIRYLKPKERAREAERERLGLISKDRQREIDILKKQAKEGQKEEQIRLGVPGYDFVQLGLVDEDKIPEYEFTAEDGKRLAKEYSRILMGMHRTKHAAESALLKLTKAAIKALPEQLREAAKVPDMMPIPKEMVPPSLTPPVEGYAERLKAATRQTPVSMKR